MRQWMCAGLGVKVVQNELHALCLWLPTFHPTVYFNHTYTLFFSTCTFEIMFVVFFRLFSLCAYSVCVCVTILFLLLLLLSLPLPFFNFVLFLSWDQQKVMPLLFHLWHQWYRLVRICVSWLMLMLMLKRPTSIRPLQPVAKTQWQ